MSTWVFAYYRGKNVDFVFGLLRAAKVLQFLCEWVANAKSFYGLKINLITTLIKLLTAKFVYANN